MPTVFGQRAQGEVQMFQESTDEVAKAVVRDLINERVATAMSDLKAFLECLTEDTFIDRSGVVRLADQQGVLLFLEAGPDKLMYSLSFDELLQAHVGQVEWTRLLVRIGEWARGVLEHYSRAHSNRRQTFSFEASEARGIVDELRRLRPELDPRVDKD